MDLQLAWVFCQGPHQDIFKIPKIHTGWKLVAYIGVHMNWTFMRCYIKKYKLISGLQQSLGDGCEKQSKFDSQSTYHSCLLQRVFKPCWKMLRSLLDLASYSSCFLLCNIGILPPHGHSLIAVPVETSLNISLQSEIYKSTTDLNKKMLIVHWISVKIH